MFFRAYSYFELLKIEVIRLVSILDEILEWRLALRIDEGVYRIKLESSLHVLFYFAFLVLLLNYLWDFVVAPYLCYQLLVLALLTGWLALIAI